MCIVCNSGKEFFQKQLGNKEMGSDMYAELGEKPKLFMEKTTINLDPLSPFIQLTLLSILNSSFHPSFSL